MCYAIDRINQNDQLHNAVVYDDPQPNRLHGEAKWDIFLWIYRERNRDNFSTAVIAFVQVVAAWIEVICSVKLIASIGEDNNRNAIWWIAMQPFGIVNHAFISFAVLKKLEMSSNFVCMLVASYTTLHLVYLTWIAFHFCSNKEGESSEPIAEPSSSEINAELPSYETCVHKPPRYEMAQLLSVAWETGSKEAEYFQAR